MTCKEFQQLWEAAATTNSNVFLQQPPRTPILKSHFSQLKYSGFRKKLTMHVNYIGYKYTNLSVFSSLTYYQISHLVKKNYKDWQVMSSSLRPHGIVHGILQARILEWVAMFSSRGYSQARDWTQVSHIAGGFFTSWATREAQLGTKEHISLDNSGS